MRTRHGTVLSVLSVAVLCAGCGGGDNGTRDTGRLQEDLFIGSGSTGPFDTRYSPILADGTRAVIGGKAQIVENALTVLVGDSEQREGVDYDAIRQIGRIIFRRIVPPTSRVTVRYYYAVRPSGLTPPPTPPSGTWPAHAE